MTRLRVGVDTGGTFTDVVVLDEATGALTTTKTPSTPADPAQGFLTGADKALAAAGAGWDAVASVFHGTTVATNALLQGEVEGLGFLTTAGFRHLLEIGRQSVPDGYGNSYFWVKPDRIVPLHLVREVPERLDATGRVLRPLDEGAVRDQAAWFRDPRGHRGGRLPAPRLRQPRPRAAGPRPVRRGLPRVLAVDQLRRAARVPGVRALGDHAGRRLRQADHRPLRPHPGRAAGRAHRSAASRSS